MPSGRRLVVDALQIVAPRAMLVKLVEYHEFRRREFSLEDSPAVLSDVPIQVASRLPAEDATRHRRLANLPWATNEDYLAVEVGSDLCFKVAAQFLHAANMRVFLPVG